MNTAKTQCIQKATCIDESVDVPAYLNFLSENDHFNNPATVHYNTDSEYRLPFLCLFSPEDYPIRALVDSGASLSILDQRSAERLKIPSLGTTVMTIAGFGSTVTSPFHIYKLCIKIKSHPGTVDVKIAGSPQLPPTLFRTPQLSQDDIKYMKKHNIWSYEYQKIGKDNHPIDMIMGNDIIAWFHSLPFTKSHVLPSGRLLETTPFGSLVHPTPNLGLLVNAVEILNDTVLRRNYVYTLLDLSEPEKQTKISASVSQMWRSQNIGAETPEVAEVAKREYRRLLAEFNEKSRYNSLQEFEVSIPFNGNENLLAVNYDTAETRMRNLTVTLQKGNNLLYVYDKKIQEMLSNGIAEKVTDEMEKYSIEKEHLVYYLTHRAIVERCPEKTKVRIAYDAYSHSKDLLSLNDCSPTDPSLMHSMFGSLIRVRTHQCLVMGKLDNPFQKVQLQEESRELTRFLWLKDVDKPATPDNIQILRFQKIPVGLVCSPFLLKATILHHLEKNPTELNKMTKENICVDKIIYHTNDKKKIPGIIKTSKKIFDKMSMKSGEYCSNEVEIMKSIPKEDKTTKETVEICGYDWNTVDDFLIVKSPSLHEEHPTKKQVASRFAETVDLLGLASPFFVPFLRLMRDCARDRENWNKPISLPLLKYWKWLQEPLRDKTIKVPRQLRTNYAQATLRLMVFSDASQDTLGACVYTHYSFETEEPIVNLLCSKNKMTAYEDEYWSIPKRELCAIEIGSNLVLSTIKELQIPVTEVCFFTDSAIALYWYVNKNNTIPYVSKRIEAIYANRDKLIAKNIEFSMRHCPTKENPADLTTRGMSTTDLQKSTLWFNGPEFLKRDRKDWPSKIEGTERDVKKFRTIILKQKHIPEGIKKDLKHSETISTVSQQKYQSFVPFNKVKSMRKLVTYIHMFLRVIYSNFPDHQWETFVMKEFAQVKEDNPAYRRKLARTLVIQQHYAESESLGYTFPSDINKYVDEDGLHRQIRQVKFSVLPPEAHKPILIHGKHILAELIIRETHELIGHLAESYTISAVRTKYSIQKDTSIAKRVIATCKSCNESKEHQIAYPNSQALSDVRIESSSPFDHIGISNTEPIEYVKSDGSTGVALILIYTCLVTRGTRLEIVPDGTSDRFTESLEIAVSRSGIPKTLYTDNKNFGYDDSSETLLKFLADRDIDYIYEPKLSPWESEMYERIMMLIKYQLPKVLKNTFLDYQSLRRVLASVEATINSRPMMEHQKAPDSMVAIRPIDFLFPGALLETPPNFRPLDSTKSRAEYRARAHINSLDKILEQWWKVWFSGFLLHLQESKHKNKACSMLNPKVGQVMFVKSGPFRRHKWPLCLVKQLNKKEKGEIRSAVVKCRGKMLTYPACHLIPLEIEVCEKETHPNSSSKKRTDSKEYKSRPTVPADLVPTENPSHLNKTTVSQDHLDKIPSTAELPIIGEQDSDDEENDIDNQVESLTPVPQIQDSSNTVPKRRTREQLPRQAKKPNVNYVHSTVVGLLPAPPRECCQFAPPVIELANLKAI